MQLRLRHFERLRASLRCNCYQTLEKLRLYFQCGGGLTRAKLQAIYAPSVLVVGEGILSFSASTLKQIFNNGRNNNRQCILGVARAGCAV